MKTGQIVQVSGPVVDARFPADQLPKIKEILLTADGETRRVMEVSQYIGNNTVRCIMLDSSDGLCRGMAVEAPGRTITVPVGSATLGRMFNVLGEPIDGEAPVAQSAERMSIYRDPPA
ncbi:MAG: F0F1 ATP synthase subunit beta, partial [Oscillospiraceae bacterium]|nr:F0F1 ATP synthase subunit beta [Oscillospiraceae bacterium]